MLVNVEWTLSFPRTGRASKHDTGKNGKGPQKRNHNFVHAYAGAAANRGSITRCHQGGTRTMGMAQKYPTGNFGASGSADNR